MYYKRPILCSSSIKFSRNHIQTAHRQNRIRNIAPLDHLRVCLVVDEAGSSEVQAERGASSVADKVKAEFAITAFHAVVHFSLRDIRFAHDYLKVIDEGLHIIIDFLLGRKVEFGHFSVERTVRHLFDGLADDAEALPHFFLTDEEPVVRVAVLTNRHFKIEVFVRRIRLHDAHVVVDAGSPKVRTCETIVKCALCSDGTHADGALHEDAIAFEQFFKLFQCSSVFLHKPVELSPRGWRKIAFEPADAADVRCQPRTAYLLVYFVDKFTELEKVDEPGEGPRIHAQHAVTNEVVGNAGKLHNNDPQVLHALWYLYTDQFLDRHVPAHVVDRRGTIIQAIRNRCYLRVGPPFSELLERPVYVPDRGL